MISLIDIILGVVYMLIFFSLIIQTKIAFQKKKDRMAFFLTTILSIIVFFALFLLNNNAL